jgi:ABC-type uncharacterized transport system involved in gliding motility auxiliary subunit
MKSRTARRADALVYTLLVVVLLVAVNLLAYRHHTRIDVTAQGLHTLSQAGAEAVAKLAAPVTVHGFVKPEERGKASDLLERFLYAAPKGMFSHTLVDPDREPGEAKKYDVTAYGTYVVESAAGKRESVTELSEAALANAIARVTLDRSPVIGFLAGHGERDLDESNPNGYASFKRELTGAGYVVKVVNWLETGSTPADVDLLIVAGPASGMTDGEGELLTERLADGKPTLIALDPGHFNRIPAALAPYGVGFIYDIILDPVSQKLGLDPLVTTATEYGAHPVVDKFTVASFFPLARSLVFEKKEGVNVTLLAQSSVDTWSETDIPSIETGEPIYDDGVDPPGPRGLVAALTWEVGPAKEARPIGQAAAMAKLIVVGDSDFAANNSIGLGGNKDLAMNMVGWLVGEENRITIRPQPKGFEPIMFSVTDLNALLWTIVVGMPLLVTLLGGFVRYRRGRS